ncbi:hypothetical protein BXZ70DRAFT_1006344 [Cristinia sonorae]|uniref:Uncharacterized protein n=1 Tax=Cristinia sonorae TaxID=1940300 RepID=A0A8K0UTN7_9AGAR|nr:hypothetical protein BXZ70DRAFT_1006344 [Cristinia sonorae]
MKPIIQWRHQVQDGPDPPCTKSFADVQCKSPPTDFTSFALVASPELEPCQATPRSALAFIDEGLPHPDIPAATELLARSLPASPQLFAASSSIAFDSTCPSSLHPPPKFKPVAPLCTPSLAGLHFRRHNPKSPAESTVKPLPCQNYERLTSIPFKDLDASNDSFILDHTLLPGKSQRPRARSVQSSGTSNSQRQRSISATTSTSTTSTKGLARCPIRSFLNSLRPSLASETILFLTVGIKSEEDLDRLGKADAERAKTGKQLLEEGLGDYYWKLVEDGLKRRVKTANTATAMARSFGAFTDIKNMRF